MLVYLFDNAAPEKRTIARALFARHVSDGSLVISTQVMQEFFVAVTRKLSTPLPIPEALAVLRQLARLSAITADTELVLQDAARASREFVSFWDALILESALATGSRTLLSEDLQHGQKLNALVVENPFITS